jgi:predicted dehydrogenase
MTTIAFVGCGHIHTPGFVNNIKKRADLAVKSVWDHDRARAERRAAELGAAVVDDPKAIWRDKKITAVIICSETDRHLPLVKSAARSRKAMFVEKPLGLGSRDGYAMAAAIEKAGVIFQTGYFMRGDPKHIFLKQQIDAGVFGKITRIRGSNCHSGALGGWFDTEWRWMADPAQSGVGAFGDLGTHSLDIMLWLMGPVEKATALLDDGTARYPNCDETGEGLMRFASGAIGTLAAAWDDVANPVGLLISGTEGHAAIINGQLYFQCAKVEGADGKQPLTQLPSGRPAGLDAFFDKLAGQDVLLVGAREAAYRSAVMEAMYAGAQKGKWIAPK